MYWLDPEQPAHLLGINRLFDHFIECNAYSKNTSSRLYENRGSLPIIDDLLKETRLPPEKVIVVGYALQDMRMGKKLGIKHVGTTWNHAPGAKDKLSEEQFQKEGANAITNNLKDLPQIVRQLLQPDKLAPAGPRGNTRRPKPPGR